MSGSAATTVPFAELAGADLVVDSIYEGGRVGNAADDPIGKLLPVGNSGGFRYRGPAGSPLVVALCTSGRDPDWPDSLDPETGIFTYYGDNRSPGTTLHDTPRRGNQILERAFAELHRSSEARGQVPPFLLFEGTGSGRDNRFLGLAVPGAPEIEPSEELVALWRSRDGLRFQNYRAHFTVLDAPSIPRRWLDRVLAGDTYGDACPEPLREWRGTGRYRALRAPRTLVHRTKAEQLPSDLRLVREIHRRFAERPHDFEACAASIWRMVHGPKVKDLELTRPSADGGRDAIGSIAIGPEADPVHLEFALEAKCYAPGETSAGVGDLMRLISRLRHRQFGVFVTTSFVSAQAYREVRDDGHPVAILAASDIDTVLRRHGISTLGALRTWLDQDFRRALA